MSIASSTTIYVGNLPSQLDEASLAAHFAPFGDIISISVPTSGAPSAGGQRRNKGFGFITFSSEDDAADALDNMNLNAIQGRTIYVNLADPSKVKEGGAGGGGGGRNRAVWDDEVSLSTLA